jgi:hypothetical protein
MTEMQFLATLIDAAHAYGYRVAHFRNVRIQRNDGSCYYATPVQADGEGFVDLVLAKRGRPILFIEVKGEKGAVSEAQQNWLHLLDRASSPALVIRPRDFDSFVKLLK